MEKTKRKGTQFLLRLSEGEAVQLDAISRRLGIAKSDVLRLSLSARASTESAKPGADLKATNNALDAVLIKLESVADRLQNVESMQGSVVDLLLSISRASQPSPAHAEPQQNSQAKPDKRGPAWSEYRKKNPKINPVMTDAAWLDFLKNRYQETHGHPPDMNT